MSSPSKGWFTTALVLIGLAASNARAADTLLAPATRPSRTASTPVGISVPSLSTANKKPLRVLFIGNSYTFFNGGLGTAVKGLASAVKDGRPFEYVEVTKGGQTLEGHWNDGKALAAIRKGGWDFVVLQEHSLGALQRREKMFQYAKMFDAEIRKTGSKTVFYETWGRKNRPEMYAVVKQAYTGLAQELKGMIAPAGTAWAAALKANPSLVLHVADLSHPTPAGTYLNACVFYETFFGKSPEGLPRTIKDAAGKVLIDLTEADAALLQRTALETCGRGLLPAMPTLTAPAIKATTTADPRTGSTSTAIAPDSAATAKKPAHQ
jgi:hypothetical protein